MYENIEEAFKDLDKREFAFFSNALAAYRKSLMEQGFTRRESMRLVESYSRFIYDMSIEEFITTKNKEEFDEDDVDEDELDDVD